MRNFQAVFAVVVLLVVCELCPWVDGQSLNQIDPDFQPAISNRSRLTSLAVQTDGKLVLGGGLIFTGQTGTNPVARLLPDGAADTSFAPQLDGVSSLARVTLQADGKILVWDNASLVNGQQRATLRRLNPDGMLDASFQMLSEPRSPATNPPALPALNQVVPQSDGKIIVGGYFRSLGGVTRWHLARLNADGSVDMGFDPGSVLTNTGLGSFHYESQSFIHSIAVQPNGKVLVAGVGFGATNALVARFNQDGSLDTAFHPTFTDTDGLLLMYAHQVIALPDGKILVGGHFSKVNGQASVCVVRLEETGQLDPSFVSPLAQFFRTLAEAPNYSSVTTPAVSSVIPRPDGKLFVTGNLYATVTPIMTALWENDGQHDTTFVPAAYAGVAPVFDNEAVPETVAAILNGGSLVFAGNSNVLGRLNFAPPASPPVITRAPDIQAPLTNSTVRLSVNQQSSSPVVYQWQFNGQNLAGATNRSLTLTNVSLPLAGAYQVAISNAFGSVTSAGAMLEIVGLPDNPVESSFFTTAKVAALLPATEGGFIAGGAFTYFGGADCAGLARVRRDGTVDAAFCQNAAPTVGSVTALADGNDGTVLVGGWLKTPGSADKLSVTRLFPDGRQVTSFAIGNGASGPANQTINTLALQADGKVLVGGYFTAFDGVARGGIARLNADGSLDGSFAPNPITYFKAFFGFAEATNSITGIAVQSDGKILLGGGFTALKPGGFYQGYARLNPDGSQDLAFQPGFHYDDIVDQSNIQVMGVALQPDGSGVVVGRWHHIGSNEYGSTGYDFPWAIARVLPNGNLDPGFMPAADLHVSNPFALQSAVPVPHAMAVALQADGKILFSANFNSALPKVVRLNSDGRLDEVFNIPGESNRVANALAALPDGRAIVAFDDGVKVLAARPSLLRLQNPAVLGQSFTISMQTLAGYTYRLESSASVTLPHWQPGAAVTGDGTMKTLTGALGVGGQSFYRVGVE
ncbi:MAG TPA: hypothetical protein VHH73_10380 [Verrucomicrobiae bacterium]|nr:hypothetical protein [Verrucomicrobiae bacterium]